MDRGLYVAMTGAKQIMQAQAVNNHNIANLSTIGFRADAVSFDSEPIYGPGYATRVNAVAGDAGTDFSSGVMQSTGRDLDIAVNGKGFIAVRGADGKEAYTRAGDLRVTPNGAVTTAERIAGADRVRSLGDTALDAGHASAATARCRWCRRAPRRSRSRRSIASNWSIRQARGSAEGR